MADACFERRARACAAAALAISLIGARLTHAQIISPDALPGDDGSLVLPSKQAKPVTTSDQPRRELPPGVTSGGGLMPAGLNNRDPALPAGWNTRGGLPAAPVDSVPRPGLTGLTGKEIVVAIKFIGLINTTEQAARRYVKTIVGRPFNQKTVQDDVKALTKAGLLPEVSYQRTGDNGMIVIFSVFEKPKIKYIKFHGNKIRRRSLLKQCGLKENEELHVESVRDARSRLQDFYHEKGFNNATVKIIEGEKPGDRGVVFLINEGQKQKVFWVEFEGNKIASDGQLRTKIKSKPPLLYLFKGEVERQRIEEDVAQITDYYRGLGFFSARVGRELLYDEKQKWLTIRFVIDEGPRSKVGKIKFVGPKLLSEEQLRADLNMTEGKFFNRAKYEKDKTAIEDKYGAKGYVFAVIQPDVIFDETPGGDVELIYQIEEGKPCVVSRVNIKIHGDNPHTRRNTILNRVSIHPGDLLSTKEVRDSERRLRGSSLFLNTPGNEPKITFDRPDAVGENSIAERPGGMAGPGGFRGQSPDPPRKTVSPRSPRPPFKQQGTR